MVRRLGSISPQKDLRRSGRAVSTVYRSLEENQLANKVFRDSELMNNLIGRANDYRERDMLTRTRAGYTRSGAKIGHYDEGGFGTTEDEDDMPVQRRTRRARHDSDRQDENVLESPDIRPHRKKRRVIVDDDDDEEAEPRSLRSSDRERLTRGGSLYDRVKRNRNSNRTNGTPEVHDMETSNGNGMGRENGVTPTSARSRRHENREKVVTENGDEEKKEEKDDDDEEEEEGEELEEVNGKEEEEEKSNQEEEEEEEEEEQEPRQYLLRTRRNPVTRFVAETRRERQPVDRYQDNRFNRPRERSRRHESRSKRRADFKRRMCRSDSSSTGDEDDRELRRSRADDERFERRKEISMFKARNRFVPVNLTEKDLSSSQSVIRERLRQTGASCSDVDPMGLDKETTFEQVGGLGAHIQSLKEVILFPLLYPDVFTQFNINPPKGVIFYGPPGTGKTLVARALANECSKGDKKVAFFMRKGADCLSKWVGESERQLRVLFDQAYAMRPSIIFFDEIDGLAPVRSSRQDQIHASIVSTLLALMDGLDSRGEVIVIGATNRLDTIDPALRRPGRFDRELKFSLPDSASRLQILDIHTSKWADSKPAPETVQWLADNTSGYCGADLKYLCTEAVLISLRARFPHIYMSSERLNINPAQITIEKEHLMSAMKRLTPASRRDLSIPSRPLDERTSILLSSTIDSLLLTRIPAGYRCSQSVHATSSNSLEKVVRALEEPPSVHAVRLLLCGTDSCPDAGQTSYVLPALLSKLDHLPVYSLAVSRLFADGRPEESFATAIQSAIRSATSGPCILLLPSIDQWYKVVPPSVAHMLSTALEQLTGFTSILFLATSDVSYTDCAEEIRGIFRHANGVQIPPVAHARRHLYFMHVTAPAKVPPKEFDESLYVAPEKADSAEIPKRRLTEKEAKELEKIYASHLREFRIFLRDQLGRLVRDRRFNVFSEPVDAEEAEDYYQIIEKPMCLTDMMDKVDRREYTHPDQFLGDIKLIMNNALEYNPNDNLHGKTIRHNAVALRDIVEEYFEKEFDEDFVEKLEETSRLLQEASIVPENESLVKMPSDFVRRTKWCVADGFKAAEKQLRADGKQNGGSAQGAKTAPRSALRRFRRPGNYRFPSSTQKKKKSAAIVKSIAASLNGTSSVDDGRENSDDVMDDDDVIDDEEREEGTDAKGKDDSAASEQSLLSDAAMSPSSSSNGTTKKLLLDNEKLNDVVVAAVQRTEDWPVPEMERLAAEMSHAIDQYRLEWDRAKLPCALLSLVENWEYDRDFPGSPRFSPRK